MDLLQRKRQGILLIKKEIAKTTIYIITLILFNVKVYPTKNLLAGVIFY